jgi:hypothetical protein
VLVRCACAGLRRMGGFVRACVRTSYVCVLCECEWYFPPTG